MPFAKGDVFVGVGGGHVDQYSPTGVLKDNLDTTTGSSEDTGMCFQASGNLLTTNWPANSFGISQFDTSGNLLLKAWTPLSNIVSHAESCAVAANGDVFVGETDGAHILKFDSSGNLLNTYNPTSFDRGIDWIDLASDQCTIYYNGEGSTIRTFDTCTNTQGPDFATGLSAPCFALRIRPGGDVLTACASGVYHLSNTGAVLHFYDAGTTFTPGESFLFAMNIDPDGTSFWTAGYSSGNVYHIDIASGTQLGEFNAPHTTSVAGLAIFGEATVGCPGCGGQGVPEFGASPLIVTALGLLAFVLFRRFRLTPLSRQH